VASRSSTAGTREEIARVRGEPLEETAIEIDASELSDDGFESTTLNS
jgi:hypothetical protein